MHQEELCVYLINACSLAMTSIEMVVGISESEKLFNSCLMIMSENVDVEEEFTLASIVLPNQLDVLVTWSVISLVWPFSKIISFVLMSMKKGSGIDVSTTPILFSTHSVNQIFCQQLQNQKPEQLHNIQFFTVSPVWIS